MPLRRNRPIAWIAAFAVLLQALWPLLSHARPGERSLLVPVCTIDGVTHFLEIKAGRKTPLDERSAAHGEHCKLCVLGANTALVTLDGGFLFPAGKTEHPASKEISAARPAAVLRALSRAPPAVS